MFNLKTEVGGARPPRASLDRRYVVSAPAFVVVQSSILSVSVGIVARRDDFSERGLPGRSALTIREPYEMSDAGAIRSRCTQDGRAPVWLRLRRAPLYRQFEIGWASKRSGALQNAILRYGRLQICATLNTDDPPRVQPLSASQGNNVPEKLSALLFSARARKTAPGGGRAPHSAPDSTLVFGFIIALSRSRWILRYV